MIWWIATAMMIVALIIILYPLWRSQGRVTLDSNTANVEVLKDQLQELESDFASGIMLEEQYDSARIDLEAAVAADLVDDTDRSVWPMSVKSRRLLSMILAVSLPLASVALYREVTTFREIPVQAEKIADRNSSIDQQHSINQMIESLATRLRNNPDDADGWVMLGKSYAVMNRVVDAIKAYDQAYQLLGNSNPKMMVDYAEVLAIANSNHVAGKSEELVNLVLETQPNNPKANWLSGFADFQRNDFNSAIEKWEKVARTQGLSDQARQALGQKIDEARNKAGLSTAIQQSQKDVAGISPVAIQVNVSLDKKFSDKVSANDAVFVFARASSGRPMPLAVARLKVSDLPATVELNDNMAMIPGHSLADKEQVVIGARISKQGTPTPVAGDIQGLSSEINPKTTTALSVLIHKVVK